MSNELKCPFCQQEYIITKDDSCFGQQRCVCRNPNCEFDGWHFPVKLVSELIRTRKALEIALDAIDKGEAALIGCQEADDKYISDATAEDGLELMSEAYKQIKALEQKDAK